MEEPDNNKIAAAESAANAAYEYEVAKDTRAFLRSQVTKEKVRPSRNLLYLTSVAASLLVLIISIVTINLSHNDTAIASAYGINKIISRTGNNINDGTFTEAVKAYYKQDYDETQRLLDLTDNTSKQVSDYKDFLQLLVTLQTAGSSSETFRKQMEAILSDENHEFYSQALNMNKDLNLFWRSLIIKK